MNIHGYSKEDKDENESIRLGDVYFYGTVEELGKIARFFTESYEYYKTRIKENNIQQFEIETNYLGHEHYRDWDKNWTKEEPDIQIHVKLRK